MNDLDFQLLLTEAAARLAREEAAALVAASPPVEPSSAYLAWAENFLARLAGAAPQNPRTLWHSFLRTVAGFVLVAGLSLGAILAVNPAARATVKHFFLQVYETFSSFSFSGEHTEVKDWSPTYLPEGFVEISHEFDAITGHRSFENEDRIWLDLQYASLSGNFEFLVDNEHTTASAVNVSGNDAVLMSSHTEGYPSYLIWSNDKENTAFLVAGDVPWQELLKVAESLEFSS